MTFGWSSICSLAFTFTLFSMVYRSEAQPKLDPDEAKALDAIFAKWVFSEDYSSSWNTSGEPCNGTATATGVSNSDEHYPFIICNCSDNEKTLCHVTQLRLNGQITSGVIPEELQNLKELTNLNLSKNYLTGPLPAFIGNLTKLQYLDFSFNALSGTIPMELGKLRNLISLAFGSNNFSSSLPSQLGNLNKLQELHIDSAGLSGDFPPAFINLKNMKVLWASDNNFTGKLPEFVGFWINMSELRLHGNAFQGPIPSSFSRLTSLKDLRIGELSNARSSLEFTSNMASLRTLILRNCMITDSFPSSFGYFQSLQHLDLSFNSIAGSIPQSLFSSSSLESLFLGNNNLYGALPSQKATQLNVIDLSYNFFSGGIPSWVSNANTKLQLNLVANNFTEDDLKNSPRYSGLNCIQRNFPCNRGSPNYSSFAINSGGPYFGSSSNINFEEDTRALDAASFYVTDSRKWAVSSVGRFIDSNNPKYNQSTMSQSTNSLDPQLLKTVRLSASSIRYYGLGLRNGNYIVKLQFQELNSPDKVTWEILGRRVFDIHMQGGLKDKDFDIKREAGKDLRSVSKEYQIQVTENFLEIHLFWAGKGTCCIPNPDSFGPLISAISAVLVPVPEKHTEKKNDPLKKTNERNLGVIVGISVSIGLTILLATFLTLILKRKMIFNTDEVSELEVLNYRAQLQELTYRAHTFSYAELKTATGGFDFKNKLGEGGFGSVYKGKLSDGREVAVKRLSLRSHQGNTQFITEIDTISAVQHRNLVKLLGCCIEGEKRLLVYEYLENNSLEQALFGKNDLDLKWETRFGICEGTARGLAYLHEESQPKIVHRDIKASNILLDAELNPKISDFGLAKLYDEKKTHISTKIAGTFGYMAPEYAMKGHLTDKTDVFAFGVVLLEILSGRSNHASNLNPQEMYLLEWAWVLHQDNRHLELIDPKLRDFNEEEAFRVFSVGLLCTQLSPSHRPSMSHVVSMLIGDVELPAILCKPSYLNDLNVGDFEGFSYALTSTTLSSDNQKTNWPGEITSEDPSLNPSVLTER